MNTIRHHLEVHPIDSHNVVRNALKSDNIELNQSEKTHEAFDAYLQTENQHHQNTWGLGALLATSSTSAFELSQAAFATSRNCPPSAEESTIRACGLAEANVILAVIGAGGAVISAKLLYEARSQVAQKTQTLNIELARKLQWDVSRTIVNRCGLRLVSQISSLPSRDQREPQGKSAGLIPEITGDPNAT